MTRVTLAATGTDGKVGGPGGSPLSASVAVASSPLGDPVGRTQVLGTSSIAAPSLRQFVFVDDAPFGAKGDVLRVTDGAMTAGTNQLSSASAGFTGNDVGKVVEVLGAVLASSATHPNLYAYVGSVAAGVATLVTTSGGSSPANATTTVAGATVTFGTDDSAAVTAAGNAVSATGGGTVGFSELKAYWFSQVTPASNLTYNGYNATFYCLPKPGLANPVASFSTAATPAAASNTTWRSMVWKGHGQEPAFQIPVLLDGCANLRFYDLDLSTFAPGGLYVQDQTGCRAVDCTFKNVCAAPPPGTATSGNPLNIGYGTVGDAWPHADILITGNRISGHRGEGMDVTTASSGGALQSTPTRVVISGNHVTGGATTDAAIYFELGGTASPTYLVQDAIIANNVCTGGRIATSRQNAPTDPTLLQRFVIAANIVNAPTAAGTNPAISFTGSHAVVLGNIIKAPVGIGVSSGTTTIALTGDFTNGSATVNNVAGGAGVTAGSQLGGNAGVPSGVFLKGGAGTTTWTLSGAFTGATAAGAAFNATLSAQNVTVGENQVHIVQSAGTTCNGIQAGYVRNSAIQGNQVTYDSGVLLGDGIYLTNCGWVRVRANDVEYAPQRALRSTSSNDLTIRGNSFYNPSAAGAGGNGVLLQSVTGTHNPIVDNDIVDDRPVHLMSQAIVRDNNCANLRMLDNTMLGCTNANPVDSFTGVVEFRGNLTDKTNWPAPASNVIAVGASPFTLTNTNPFTLQVFIYGGTMSAINVLRNGTWLCSMPTTGGAVLLEQNDAVAVTFTAAPTMRQMAMQR